MRVSNSKLAQAYFEMAEALSPAPESVSKPKRGRRAHQNPEPTSAAVAGAGS
jgi:hypothetical protein